MAETTKLTNEDMINQMYDASLTGQKTQLEQNYNQGLADLEHEQQKLREQTDANLNRTYVEAAKAQKNWNEVQNAYGLSSGAMGQARLAQDNQLQADLTALRGAQAQIDSNIERERTMLSQEYMAAIAQAQADNDLQRAQALYDQAKADEAQLRQNQKEAGNLMASVGDYSILANLYGLTPQQLALLMPNGAPGAGGNGGNSVSKYFDASGNPKGFSDWEEYLEYLKEKENQDNEVTTGMININGNSLILTPDGKTALENAVASYAGEVQRQPTSIELEGLIQALYADGALTRDEYDMLRKQYE